MSQNGATGAHARHPSDPIPNLGRLLAQMHAAHCLLGLRTAVEAPLLQLIDQIEEEASSPATTLTGALVQIMLARADADTLASYAPDAIQEKYMRRIDRYLSSAQAVLADCTGADPNHFAAGYYAAGTSENHQAA
jgi:hypothetical protein